MNDLKNAGIYTGIENRICELKTDSDFSEPLKITGRFFYLTFRGKEVTEKEFAKFVYDKITRYCIPRYKIQEAKQRYIETDDERYLNDLHDQARNLFVKNIKEHGSHLGEPGELITFMILEAFFDAPQIACKMFLKTSEKMPVHGSDSVHIRISNDGEKADLIWGEAKMYSSLSGALGAAIKSINEFINGKSDSVDTRAPRDRDIDIIKDHPNVDSKEMREKLLKYFDPYEKESNNLNEVFMCMVGFDYSLYHNLSKIDENEIENYFREKYMKKIKEVCDLFEQKIKENNMTNLEFAFVLLPFKSLENFRNEFYKLLGISKHDLGDESNDRRIM